MLDGDWPGLLERGECRDRSFAFFSICVTEAFEVLSTCLASLCALLATTDPNCVVVAVNPWVYVTAGDVLRRNGVVPIIAPEWAPLHSDHPYADAKDHEYSFAALEAFRLSQYDRIATFDIDILFMRNASALRDVEAFAASRILKGKDPSQYMNTGVTVIRPSPSLHSELITAWRQGDYQLHYSDDQNLHQDVVHEVCITRALCGPVTDLDACIYNHGVWLPEAFTRNCSHSKVVARHNFKASREDYLASMLESAMRRGKCRAQVAQARHVGRECWDSDGLFTHERCCQGAVGGNLQCWGHGHTFERCCLGVDESAILREELISVGDSWYGLSSVPMNPAPDFFGNRCFRQYERQRNTMTVLSGLRMGMSSEDSYRSWPEWRSAGPPPAVLSAGIKCVGLATDELHEDPGRFVIFRLPLEAYFARYAATHPGVAALRRDFLASPDFQIYFDTLAVCVPTECCMQQPIGTNSSMDALRAVLWAYVADHLLNLVPRDSVPAPAASDFEAIYLVNPEDAFAEWRRCFRTDITEPTVEL